MSPRCGTLVSILLLLICVSATPNVQAQTTTITNLQYPKQVVFLNGMAQATVTFTVGFSGVPSGGHLGFVIVDATTGTATTLKGSASSTPDSCTSLTGTSYAGTAMCLIVYPASSSGTEYASFVVTFDSIQQYKLGAVALIEDLSNNVISSSRSTQAFSISVTAQVQLTLNAQPTDVTVTVDGVAYTGSQFPKVFTWDLGSTHSFQVNQTIQGRTGVRYVFVQWSDGSKDTTRTVTPSQSIALSPVFKTQYQLNVISDYGDPQGTGWYDAGSEAKFSVTSPRPEAGFLGALGEKMLLQGWTGDSKAISPEATVNMDGPKTVRAQWVTDDSQAYMILGGAIIAALAVATIVLTLRRRQAVFPHPRQRAWSEMQQPTQPAAPYGAKFCVYCGKPIPASARFCKTCGKPQD